MKKHLISMLIIILVLALIGTGAWLVITAVSVKPLYNVSCDFILDDDTDDLKTKMTQAQTLYNSILSSETRLNTLHTVVAKIDSFEQDLNSYLVLSTVKASSTRKLSKSYSSLIKSRKTLIKNYDEYITRMSGDLNADGPAIQKLYDDIFNKTVDYLYQYNSCFKSTSNHVFNKVYKVDSIKEELYALYSLGVNSLLNSISNNRFASESVTLITRLNNGIKLTNGNLHIKSSVDGGEFNVDALKFKQHFNKSNSNTLITNFNTYYSESINIATETSNEKLAVYYAKKILEI